MKDYSFVDMHIHTEHSDEELCDMTIEQLLAKAQAKAESCGKDCVIAISDHNTILGVKKARQILNSNEGKINYPNVKLINGIEFTTDLVEMTSYFEGNKVFTRCHTLAYGYDENNKELTAYSRITHKHFTKNDNIGMQICSARRLVSEMYCIDIPFSVYESLAYANKSTKFKTEFLRLTNEYALNNKIRINIKDIDNIISPYISDVVDFNREASAMGRLKVSEIGKLVKDAGGELVIAHPTLIRVTVDGLRYLANKKGVKFDSLYKNTTTKYKNNTDFGYVKNQELVFNTFLDAYESIIGYKISGIEKYYSSNFSSRMDLTAEKICNDRGMYETCGSDYHGEHLHPDKDIGNVLHNTIQENYRKQTGLITLGKNPINICSLSAVDYFMSGKKVKLPNKAILKTSIGEVKPADFENAINLMISNKNKIKVTSSTYDEVAKVDLDEKVNELNYIVERLDTILEEQSSPRKQAKLILRLNLFTENIISGIREIKFKANKYAYMRTLEKYKDILKVLNDIHTKYTKLLKQNPKILKNLKYDMRYYYKRDETTIDKLANIRLDAPINKEVELKLDK
ncbi:MAG: hypothetical protein SOV27_02490 [Eubacteriales bacterium]|nr:hypothetical protein [Eubacteriales bacterium]